MKIRKECVNNFKTNYIMIHSKDPTLVNVADDLNRNYNYMRQVFSGQTTSRKLAQAICKLGNMEIEELFENDDI